MADIALFELKLRGGLADRHIMEGFDGYNALAGAAYTLALVANYVETGVIRYKGQFIGRHIVLAEPIAQGSILAKFKVLLTGDAEQVFDIPEADSESLLYGLVRRVVQRNFGLPADPLNSETEALLEDRAGEVEELVLAVEPSLRRAHEAIGPSAGQIEWTGGFSTMGTLDPATKEYLKASIPEGIPMTQDVTVRGFYGNTGRGLIYDPTIDRNISVSMRKETLAAIGRVFSYGLDQYLNRTGNTIRIEFTRLLSSDGRPKHYVITGARATRMLTPSRPV